MAQPFDKLIDPAVAAFMRDDDEYFYHSTYLKTADLIKQQHIQQIQEFLKFRELTEELEKANDVLMHYLPGRVTDIEMEQIKGEIAGVKKHFLDFLLSLEGEAGERPIILQEMCGFSDQTLLSAYALAFDLMHEGKYSVAFTLLVFLTTLAPHVQSYWIAEGICLQELNRHEEAATIFEGAMLLDLSNPMPYAYSIISYTALKEEAKSEDARNNYKLLIQNYEGSDKEAIKVLAESIS